MSDDAESEPECLKARYGSWAVITGASDGTGAAFARLLAAGGLNLLLVARRAVPLEALASELRAKARIQVQVACVDLYQADAPAQLISAAAGLDVGLFISNAGADTNGSYFLDAPLLAWHQLIQRNVVNVTALAYAFAAPMRIRGRGGIVLMSSAAGLGGQPGAAIYGATKAFDLHFGESLWAELHPAGVDVLVGVCPPMNTPSLQKLLSRHGTEVPGLYDPASVAAALMEHLPRGPLRLFQFGPDDAQAIEQARRARITKVTEIARIFFGPVPDGATASEPAPAPPRALPLCSKDERAIEAVLVRYATAIDMRDWVMFRSCFTRDCTADYGAFGLWHDADEMTAAMQRMHAQLGATLHRVTNFVIAPTDQAAVARSAQARTYVDAILTASDSDASPRQGIGLYEDRLVETSQGWKIASRQFTPVHIR